MLISLHTWRRISSGLSAKNAAGQPQVASRRQGFAAVCTAPAAGSGSRAGVPGIMSAPERALRKVGRQCCIVIKTLPHLRQVASVSSMKCLERDGAIGCWSVRMCLTQARGLCDDSKSVAFGLAAAVLVGFALWRSGLLQDSHGGLPPASHGSQTRRGAPRSSPATAAQRSAPATDDGRGVSCGHMQCADVVCGGMSAPASAVPQWEAITSE